MSDHQIKARWVTPDSQEKLTDMLGLPTHLGKQDWELIYGDSRRLGEFLDLYEYGALCEDDRFALMALIVSSFDEWLALGGTDASVIERVRRHLVADFGLHESTIHYWCAMDEPEPPNLERVFHVTGFMREIWKQRT